MYNKWIKRRTSNGPNWDSSVSGNETYDDHSSCFLFFCYQSLLKSWLFTCGFKNALVSQRDKSLSAKYFIVLSFYGSSLAQVNCGTNFCEFQIKCIPGGCIVIVVIGTLPCNRTRWWRQVSFYRFTTFSKVYHVREMDHGSAEEETFSWAKLGSKTAKHKTKNDILF